MIQGESSPLDKKGIQVGVFGVLEFFFLLRDDVITSHMGGSSYNLQKSSKTSKLYSETF